MRALFGVGLMSVALLGGCGGDDETDAGEGSLEVVITGEDAAKDGFPVSDDGEVIAFSDGDWQVVFDKYLVSFGNLRVRSSDGGSGYETGEIYVADMTQGDPTVADVRLSARRWDRLSFEVVPAQSDATRLNEVSDEDVQRMVEGGLTYWVTGTATLGDDSYRLELALSNPTTNNNCTNGLDNTDGVVVKNNSSTVAELTVHIEHMFWDRLGSEQTLLRFAPFAASAGSDGLITLETLATQRLADLQGLEGPLVSADGLPIIYDPGSTPLPDQNLAEFVRAATSTQVHLNGEGLCTVTQK